MRTTYRRSARRIAGVAGAGLVAASIPLMTAGTAQAGTISKGFTYDCNVVAGGLPIGVHAIGVKTKVTVPSSVKPGGTVSSRKVSITLAMPETLRDATYNMLGARSASGSSSNASVGVTINGKSRSFKIAGLAAPKSPVPADGGTWTIPTSGTVPKISVPKSAYGKASLSMPKGFTIDATISDRVGGVPDAAVTMTCMVDGSRALGSITVAKVSSSTAASVTPKKPVVRKTRAKVKVQVRAVLPRTGTVKAYLGKKKVGAAKVSSTGKATIKLKKFSKKGKQKLTLKYSGNKQVKPSTKKIKVTVKKR